MVFTTVTVTALAAGGLHHLFGYKMVNVTVVPMFLVIGLAILWLALIRRKTGQSVVASQP